jgi:hypothetical protein
MNNSYNAESQIDRSLSRDVYTASHSSYRLNIFDSREQDLRSNARHFTKSVSSERSSSRL